MKPWQPGDPVACGVVYLPDRKTRQAYGEACRKLWIEPAAQHAISLPTLQARRDFIYSYPSQAREELMERVKQIWEAKK